MRTTRKIRVSRQKLSTTVSPETHRYLEKLVKSGHAVTIADAVDLVVRKAQRTEKRAKLERDTAAYFANLPAPVLAEEARLESALSQSADEAGFDE